MRQCVCVCVRTMYQDGPFSREICRRLLPNITLDPQVGLGTGDFLFVFGYVSFALPLSCSIHIYTRCIHPFIFRLLYM